MKNLIVGQSGGPTAVINSSLYGVIREGFNRSEEIEHVYGMINGIQGFLDGRFMDMKELDNDTLEALRTTPGAYLGSCRFKLPDDLNDAIYPLLFQKFEDEHRLLLLYRRKRFYGYGQQAFPLCCCPQH